MREKHLTYLSFQQGPNGPQRDKTCLQGFANNKDANQPVRPHSLIRAFVIHLLESIESKLDTREIKFSS